MTVSQFVAVVLLVPPLGWLLLAAARPGPLAFFLFAAGLACAGSLSAVWRLLHTRG